MTKQRSPVSGNRSVHLKLCRLFLCSLIQGSTDCAILADEIIKIRGNLFTQILSMSTKHEYKTLRFNAFQSNFKSISHIALKAAQKCFSLDKISFSTYPLSIIFKIIIYYKVIKSTFFCNCSDNTHKWHLSVFYNLIGFTRKV